MKIRRFYYDQLKHAWMGCFQEYYKAQITLSESCESVFVSKLKATEPNRPIIHLREAKVALEKAEQARLAFEAVEKRLSAEFDADWLQVFGEIPPVEEENAK